MKDLAGRTDLVGAELQKMHRHLLAPLGVAADPDSVDEAVERYDAAVSALGWELPTALAGEVRRGLRRAGYRS